MTSPEAKARKVIGARLAAAGRGITVRLLPTIAHGFVARLRHADRRFSRTVESRPAHPGEPAGKSCQHRPPSDRRRALLT